MASAHRETGRRWVSYALLRQEWTDGQWLPVMPSAGFSYRIMQSGSLMLKGNLSRNYNLPSLNDLYWIPGGNPGLQPENSLNADLALEYLQESENLVIKGALNGFAARVENWILWKPTRFRYWEAENLARVDSRGFDIQLASDMVLGDWLYTLNASYACTRSTNEGALSSNDQSRGKQLMYVPVHTAAAYMNLARKGYYLNWSATYTGRRYTQPGSQAYAFTESLDPFTLNDLHIGKTWAPGGNKAGFRFSIYNIMNVSYQAIRSRPMPGRNYALTITLEI